MRPILTNQKCACGDMIEMHATRSDLEKTGVGWGDYARDSGSDKFSLKCSCPSCGLIYDPDHDRFAPYYNEAADHSCS